MNDTKKFVVIGLGIQGQKRKSVDKKNCVATVDPIIKKADFKKIQDVPLKLYNMACVCVPENQKYKNILYLIKNKKNVLVEKPLLLNYKQFSLIKKISKKNKVLVYVAYNHRFEKHVIKAKKIIDQKKLGKIYYCKMFYGNGTAKLINKSKWKDQGKGCLTDLGSHLLDFYYYLFNLKKNSFQKNNLNFKFENKSSDFFSFDIVDKKKFTRMEMTYCMWKNTFHLDLIAKNGSLHIRNFPKWGGGELIIRKRKFPSGKPAEKIYRTNNVDLTWLKEYQFFKRLIKINKTYNNLEKDIWISKFLRKIKI